MNKSRKLALSLFDHLYEFNSRNGDRLKCVYCGDIRECSDHSPPVSTVGKVGTKKLKELGVKFYKYPCCKTCNTVLSDKPLITFEERILFLYNKLLAKSDKASLWNNSEIEELDGELKRQIKAKQLHIRREIITRLRGMEERLSSLEP